MLATVSVVFVAVMMVVNFATDLWRQSRVEPAAEILSEHALVTDASVVAYALDGGIHLTLADDSLSFVDMTLQSQPAGVVTSSALDNPADTYDLGGDASVVWSGGDTAALVDPDGGVWHLDSSGGGGIFDDPSATEMGVMLDVLVAGGLTGDGGVR